MINAVIFDFAGVITTEGFWAWLEKTVPDLDEKRDFFMSLADKADRGEFSGDAYSKKLAEATGRPVDNLPDEILDLYTINPEMVTLLKELQNTVKLGLLSNFPSGWLRTLLKKFNLESFFDQIVISSEVHMIKPEKQIFDYSLSLLHSNPQETLFVDDREVNVVGAQKAGLPAVKFVSAEQVQEVLQKSRLLA